MVRLLNFSIHTLSLWLNSIAGFVLVGMMFLTGLDVSLRYLFNSPIPGSIELTQYMMPIVITFGLAQCAKEKGHVNVELFISKLSGRKKALMNSVINLFFFILFGLITWQSILRALGMMASGLKSEVLSFPIFPFVLMVSLGCGVLSLVVLMDFIKSLMEVLK